MLFVLALLLPVVPGRAESAAPVRAVSLAPSLTELVFAMGLGDRLVGRSSACDYPAEAQGVPVAGDFGRPNWEVVQGLKPKVVLATDLEKAGMARHLERSGIRVLLLPSESWDRLTEAAQEIGRALGEPAAAETWVAGMAARRAALEKRVEDFWRDRRRPRIYVEVWGDPPTTAGKETFLDELVSMAGGKNIAGDLRGTYIHVSSEWIIAQDPDVILLAYMTASAPRRESLARRPGWGSMQAVKDGAVCANIPPECLLRPGPRLMDGAEALAEWLMNYQRSASSAQATEAKEVSGQRPEGR